MTTYDYDSLIDHPIEDAIIYNGTHGSQVKGADPKGKKIALGGNKQLPLSLDHRYRAESASALYPLRLSHAQEFDCLKESTG